MVVKKTVKPAKKPVTSKKKPVAPKKKPAIAYKKPVFIEKVDRVIRSGNSGKNAACPECGSFPTITSIRRPGYELRRCRECGHRFEIKKGGK